MYCVCGLSGFWLNLFRYPRSCVSFTVWCCNLGYTLCIYILVRLQTNTSHPKTSAIDGQESPILVWELQIQLLAFVNVKHIAALLTSLGRAHIYVIAHMCSSLSSTYWWLNPSVLTKVKLQYMYLCIQAYIHTVTLCLVCMELIPIHYHARCIALLPSSNITIYYTMLWDKLLEI